MGMTGALKFRTIVGNVEYVAAIELMAAAQGLDFRRPLRSSPAIEGAYDAVRTVVTRLDEDRALSVDIEALTEALRAGAFDRWCETEQSPP